MPTTFAKAAAYVGGFLIFIMVIAAISRVLTTKESPVLVKNGASFIAKLFRGVFK